MYVNSQNHSPPATSFGTAPAVSLAASESLSEPPEGAQFRMVAWMGPHNRERVDRFSKSSSHALAAREFAAEFQGETFPARWEQPVNGGRSVRSFGWTCSGLRIWVYEL
ncbi:hypothetical protein [Paraburkholderia youngii]|uniref:hypothetical protein n=1 Tax=Paraburkholderia youngii TaxID=2782701 RepID=UPI003D1BD80C